MTYEKRIIGDCTLYRGDCLELLAAGVFGKIGAIVSDPPYGIGYQHGGNDNGPTSIVFSSGNVKMSSRTDTIIGDDQPFQPQPWIDAAPTARNDTLANAGSPLIVLFGADNVASQ